MQFDGATGGISSSQVNTDYGYSSVPSGSEDPKKSLKQNLEENSAWWHMATCQAVKEDSK